MDNISEGECQDRVVNTVGPVVAAALIIEAITVVIAIVSCVYLSKRSSPQHLIENGEDDSATIRVVHNTLYQTMRADQDATSPVKSEAVSLGQHLADLNHQSREEDRIVAELSGDKNRTRTQSSHTYEPIGVPEEGEINQVN